MLDVKYGSGAFMQDPDDAVRLAETLVGLARTEGVRATAVLTAMWLFSARLFRQAAR